MDPILRLPQVRRVTGLSTTTIYQLMNDGQFPRPLKLSARSVGWRSSDIEAWLSALKAA